MQNISRIEFGMPTTVTEFPTISIFRFFIPSKLLFIFSRFHCIIILTSFSDFIVQYFSNPLFQHLFIYDLYDIIHCIYHRKNHCHKIDYWEIYKEESTQRRLIEENVGRTNKISNRIEILKLFAICKNIPIDHRYNPQSEYYYQFHLYLLKISCNHTIYIKNFYLNPHFLYNVGLLQDQLHTVYH